MQNYSNLQDEQKLEVIYNLYHIEQKSFQEIADMYDTYPNKIRRDAKQFGIKIRTKSEAQKLALETGKHGHPTKGKTRNKETKQKIGKSVMEYWEQIPAKELERRSTIARQNWEALPEEEKKERFEKANQAVRTSSKTGSKLEKFLHSGLLNNGYRVEPQKKNILNTNLHIDLFLPELSIAIEVDGPSHFSPVWGENALKRAQRYDQKKNGILIGKGIKVIRVQQKKDFSNSRSEKILKKLIKSIEEISVSGTKSLVIGDE